MSGESITIFQYKAITSSYSHRVQSPSIVRRMLPTSLWCTTYIVRTLYDVRCPPVYDVRHILYVHCTDVSCPSVYDVRCTLFVHCTDVRYPSVYNVRRTLPHSVLCTTCIVCRCTTYNVRWCTLFVLKCVSVYVGVRRCTIFVLICASVYVGVRRWVIGIS